MNKTGDLSNVDLYGLLEILSSATTQEVSLIIAREYVHELSSNRQLAPENWVKGILNSNRPKPIKIYEHIQSTIYQLKNKLQDQRH